MTSDNPETGTHVRAQESSLLDEVFLDLLASGEFVTTALATVGWRPRTYYDRRSRDADFAKLVDDASEAGFEALADKAYRIAQGDKDAGATGDTKRDTLICKQASWLLEKRAARFRPHFTVDQRTGPLPPPAFSDDPNEASRQYQDWLRGQ